MALVNMKIKRILIGVFFSIGLLAGANEDLLESVHKANLSSVLSLLNNGANANFKDNNTKPLLSIAVEKRNVEIVQLLLEKGAKVNATEKSKVTPEWTALMHAAESGNIEIVQLLLKYEANKKQKNGKGYDALYLAELWGHNEVAAILRGEDNKVKKDYPSEKISFPVEIG